MVLNSTILRTAGPAASRTAATTGYVYGGVNAVTEPVRAHVAELLSR